MEPETHVQSLICITEDLFQRVRAVSTALNMFSAGEASDYFKGEQEMFLKLSDYLEEAARGIEKAIADRDELDGLGPVGFERASVFDND
jgi:glutaredoxin 2